MNEETTTPSGDPIHRYSERTKDFEPAFGDSSNMEAISDHIEKHVGEIHSVFHEIVSDIVHIDVYWVKPSDRFPFHVLVTSGMSDKAMNVPGGLEDQRYAELCVLLPASWHLGDENKSTDEVFSDENNYWPIRWMKIIARFPHEYNTWLGWGHTIPNGEDAEPFSENTKLGCMMLYPSISLPPEFFELATNDGKVIRFYCLMPLYKEEMEIKLAKGGDELTDKFEKFGISDVIDPDRLNVGKKKGFFGLW